MSGGVSVREDASSMPASLSTEQAISFADTERFRIVRQLGTGGMGVVYEAVDLERGGRVALKTLRTANPQTLYRFKHEFRALAEIVHPRLVRLFELISDGERWFFTMELIDDGVNLLEWLTLDGAPAPPRESLTRARTAYSAEPSAATADSSALAAPTRVTDLSGVWSEAPRPEPRRAPARSPERIRAVFAQLAEGVRVLHLADRLHRDLKPENVFVRASTEEVVLLDFGLVAALEHSTGQSSSSVSTARPEAEEPVSPKSDSHAYLATEAGTVAGTFAYMAPEQAMAKPLTAAADWYAVGVMLYEVLTGQLPFHGSPTQIVMSKRRGELPKPPAECVPGVPEDLNELCMELLRHDPAARPTGAEVVQRLGGVAEDEALHEERLPFVGRQRQLELLWQSLESARQGTSVVHVQGRSGAGKSVLIARFLSDLAARTDTLVIAGRCYEQEFIPFKAIDNVMDALTRYLLKLPEYELAEIVPPDATVLSRVFPVLGRLLPLAEAAPDTADLHSVRQRAFSAMRELLRRLSERVRLVLFIDDLQWGDVDSAALLAEVLRPPDAPKLLLLLAYRSEHRSTNPSLLAFTTACNAALLERETHLEVGLLAPEDARALALRLLGEGDSRSALDGILEQAGGSAFLIHELANDARRIGGRTRPEGRALDDILWERVRALDDAPRELVNLVVVAGRPVRLRHAQRAARIPALAPPLVDSLCRQRLLRTEGTGSATELETFHDRVRESVLARLGQAEVARYAASLAEVLEAAEERDAETLAALFERAGQLGRASGYYAAAVKRAVSALAFERAATLAEKAIALAGTDAERTVAYEAAIHFHTDMASFPEAYALTRRGCSALGLELPAKFIPPLLIADFAVAKLRMRGRRPEQLLELPAMPNGRLELAVRIANAGAKAAFQVRPELCVSVCTKIVRLCLEHGNTPDCAIGYMVFGAIFQGGILGRYKTGYELGQLALALVDKYANERQRAEVSFVVGYFGMSWLRPAQDAEALWSAAFEAGRTSGDLFHMGCSAASRMMSFAMRGVPLAQIERESAELCGLLARNGLREPLAVVVSVRQAARDLSGATRARGSWDDAGYDQRAAADSWSTFGARHFAHYCQLSRTLSFYLWGQAEQALISLKAAQRSAPESKGMLHSAEHVFVEALVRAAVEPRSLATKLAVGRAASKLRGWARRCPANFAHKAELVHAESLRLLGRRDAALSAYSRAAALAAEFGYVHVEGMAQWLKARLHAEHGERELRDHALAEAAASFRRWGAVALADTVAQDPLR
jgi:serine/threonine protein kinase/predicted ATPase